jgi:predicted DCC family thiol-disulfide oxidoreductase YuxK
VSDPFAGEPVLFYDGGCGLCHRAVRLLLRLDKRGRLRFAPLAGETFRRLVPEGGRPALPDSLVLVVDEGPPLVRSAAVVEALRATGGFGRGLAALSRLVPRPLADGLYDAVAGARRRLFTPPRESCPVAPGALRGRFLP